MRWLFFKRPRRNNVADNLADLDTPVMGIKQADIQAAMAPGPVDGLINTPVEVPIELPVEVPNSPAGLADVDRERATIDAEPAVAEPAVAEPEVETAPHSAMQGIADVGITALASPFGPGSALPLATGAAPAAEYRIKGNTNSMLYHTTDSPYYPRIMAEVWFRSEEDARRAGFASWKRLQLTVQVSLPRNSAARSGA